MKVHKTITYEYKNAPIPGGGYVTGLLYHPKQPGILYARTDIGGVYRYEYEKKCWKSLIDSVSMADISETFPIACALDEKKPERLYIMSGINGQGYGKFSISENYGETFIHKKIPVTVHGNLCGRGTGYRLVVDKKDENTLYFASQLDGLWKTTDRGDTWERLPLEENYMTCVWVSDDSKTIVAGTAGYTTRESDTLRGHSLYVSYDAGQTFEKLMQPENVMIHDSKMNGLVASRYDYDGTYLYVTMNVTGRWNYVVDLGYSCDSGDVIGGKVLRYYFSDGKIAGYDDITPDADGTLTAEFLNYGFGGILADDMGLGKTLQTISFLTSVAKKETKILILAPSSLIYNWKQEFSKFAPQMEVAVVYGLKQHRDELIATNPQAVITSYASFRQDVEEYQKNQYEYLILDEAQVMKNAQTKIAQHLRGFEVPHVFALSGTPIENHVGELWSIFQIVLPGLFPAKKEFQKLSPETIARFVKPFVMRRKKDEVLQELPDLIETTYHNELDESQKTIYLAQLKQIQDRVRSSSEEELNRSKVEILSGLMRLRQICDTPALFMEDYQGDSGKLESLRDLLGQIKDGEHRVLIFSQFRGMLDILEQEIDQLGMTSFKITGSTPAKDRQEMTNAFNAGERHAFLISLKAGGVGLNLTGADTVILVDLWWNPAVEDQAIGRAHRMGQEQNVEVYRMITRGTIEEKIQELQASKRHLVSTILDGTETRSSLSVEEIREILGIQSE